AALLAGTGVWAFVLLGRTPDWLPALRWVLLTGSVVVALGLAVGAQRGGRVTVGLAALACVLGLGAPAAYSIETVAQNHGGPMATSGPAKAESFGRGGPFGQSDNAQLQALVSETDTRWAAAAIGSMQVSDLELKTGESLMAIGGFTGGDPSPTLAEFQQYVADGQVRYFIASGHGGPPGQRGGSAGEITSWVEQTFAKSDVGGTTVYDLESPRS
ncbi:MAG: glycosyl transferase, family 39, partial [Mycobacterium sp.]|nr:glycosyl transferase, family 39 [Mycobacterium sp.]